MPAPATSTASSTPVAPRSNVVQYFLLTVVLWCALPLSPQGVDSDFWGHVQYGRDVWQHGLDRTATYTYNAIGHPWINHENLCELIFAWFADGPGIAWLLLLKCVLGLGVLGWAMHRALRQGVHPILLAPLTVLAAINLSFYWGVRPHMLSFAFFGLMIGWTDWCFEPWQGSWAQLQTRTSPWQSPTAFPRRHGLWLLAILLTIWTNTHGGFLAGLAVIQALLGARAIQLLLSSKLRSGQVATTDKATDPTLIKFAVYLGVVMLGIALATLFNPYGIGLHQWLAFDLAPPRPEILEWGAPNLASLAAWKIDIVLALIVIGLAGNWRHVDLSQAFVIALVAYETVTHERHSPFLILLFAFWMPVHLQATWNRLHTRFAAYAAATEPWNWVPTTRSSRSVAWSGIACLLLAVYAATLAYQVGGRFSIIPVKRTEYPVSAIQFMAQHGLTGRLVTAGNWAQYALCVLGARTPSDPGVQVAFDGRLRTCYPQEVIDLHFDFVLGDGGPDKRYRSPSSPPADPKRILEYNQPELLLLNRGETHAQQVLASVANDWVLLYQDQLAQVWGRRMLFDSPESPRYFPPEYRGIGETPQLGYVAWPAAPESRPEMPSPGRLVQAGIR